MITLTIILILLGLLLSAVCMGAIVLIDPIICILIIVGLVTLISKLRKK